MKNIPSKEELLKLHIEENLKIDDVAKKFGVSRATISRWFKKYGIPSKNSVGSEYDKITGAFVKELEDYDTFYNLYVTEGKSLQEIGDMFNKPYGYVRYRAIKLGIPIRDANSTRYNKVKKINDSKVITYEGLFTSYVIDRQSKEEIANRNGVSVKEISRRLKSFGIKRPSNYKKGDSFRKYIHEDLKSPDVLRKLYWEDLMSCKQIAEKYGEKDSRIKTLMDEYGIPRRSQKEAAKILVGEKSPHWKGVSYGLYDKIRAYSRDNLHKIAKERDNFTCQFCGSKENLQVHHKKPLWKIYYEILEEHPEYDRHENIEELREIMVNDKRINDIDNLITCCEECHLFKLHGYTHKQVEALKDRRRVKYFY